MRLLITGYPGWLSNRFLATLAEYAPGFDSIRCLTESGQAVVVPPDVSLPVECVAGNLLDMASLRTATRDMDLVLHAAGIIHVKKIPDFYRVNRDGTRNLLDACLENGVKRFIHISSNAAQGFCERKGHVLTEADPCRPENDYGRSKLEGEKVVQGFQKTGKIETVIIRPAMFYGPPVPVRHVGIFKQVRKGYFPVFGSGDYSRSVTYIDNLIQAIHLAMKTKAASGQIYTITDREIPTLLEVVKTMGHSMGREVRILHFPVWMAVAAGWVDRALSALGIYWMLPHIVAEAHRNIAYSIAKAEKELGYDPKINYQEGYARTIKWCGKQGLI